MDTLGVIRNLSHRATWFVGKAWPTAVPLTFVLGYPKSGTTWVCQLISDYFRIPFPQHSIFPIGCRAVVHGHEVVTPEYPRGVYVMRDGRDALASFYFHAAREIPDGPNPVVKPDHRRAFPGLVDKHDVRANIGPFVRVNMDDPLSSKVTWGEHVRSFARAKNPGFVRVKYEDLVGEQRVEAFARAMADLDHAAPDHDRARATLDRLSFARITGRNSGQEDRSKFVRKGQPGDWANHFTREAADAFDRACGEALIEMGYEPDHAWVERCR